MNLKNQIIVNIAGGFQVSLPKFTLCDPKEKTISTDYHGKVILLALLMNKFLSDEELKTLAKSYKAIICKLKKVSATHGYHIHRVRGKGYHLTTNI